MRRPAGKLIAWLLAAACVAIAGTLWGLRERIAEEWWLRKLEARAKEERNQAAERLGAMGSLRAIPRLLRRVETARPLHIAEERTAITFPCYVPDAPVARRVIFHEGDDQEADREVLAALRAIVAARGEASIDHLLAGLQEERLPVQRRAVELLGSLGPRAERAVPALGALLGSLPEPQLEAEVVDALHRIGVPPAPAVRELLARRGWQR
jgi:HEAT repeat protein